MSSHLLLGVSALVVLGGCAADSARTPPVTPADMAKPGVGGGGDEPEPDLAMPAPSLLPFVVDSAFVTSGFMGDGETAGLVTMVPAKPGDSTDCNGARASTTSVGSCHSIVYTPPASGGKGWAGVYWQYPANNWGAKAGYMIPAGAKQVTFKAKGAAGGEKVTFLAGGIINAGMPHTDSLKATATVTLTSEWASYSLDLSGQSYSQVLGGFAWTMAATDAAASGKFFVDDIAWQ